MRVRVSMALRRCDASYSTIRYGDARRFALLSLVRRLRAPLPRHTTIRRAAAYAISPVIFRCRQAPFRHASMRHMLCLCHVVNMFIRYVC